MFPAAKHANRLPAFKARPFRHAVVGAQTKQELLEILIAPRTQWRRQGRMDLQRIPYREADCSGMV